jgi:hypothetical protein
MNDKKTKSIPLSGLESLTSEIDLTVINTPVHDSTERSSRIQRDDDSPVDGGNGVERSFSCKPPPIPKGIAQTLPNPVKRDIMVARRHNNRRCTKPVDNRTSNNEFSLLCTLSQVT